MQGYDVKGKVMFLGGPLYHCKGLRERFVKTLKLDEERAVFPEYGLVSVALGAAIYASDKATQFTYDELYNKIQNSISQTAVVNEAKRIKETYPDVNIVAIDYDAGASRVNQENRIKLSLNGKIGP